MQKKTFLPGKLKLPTSKAPNLISMSLVALLSISLMSFKTGNGKGAPGDDNKRKKDSIGIAANSKQFASLLSPETNTSTANHAVPGEDVASATVGLNPHVADFARSYLYRERVDLNRMKSWAQPYFQLFDRILSQNGIPVQLKYLAVIESSLSSTLRSHAGALGPWQLMSYEAKEYGLKMGKHDERTDYAKSTEAACKLLNSLHDRYDDWLLVIAAYNGGIGAVNRAIKKAGSDDFWDIQQYLPTETRNHVKKFISTHYFFEGNGGFTTMTADEVAAYKARSAKQGIDLKNVNTAGTDVIEVSGIYNVATICKALNIDEKRFRELNPGFNKTLANGLSYPMRLPSEKIQSFNNSKEKILEASFHQLIDENGAVANVRK